jgi:hypothetical protein
MRPAAGGGAGAAAAAAAETRQGGAAAAALAYIFDAEPQELQPGAAQPAAGGWALRFSQQLRAAEERLRLRHAAAASQASQQAIPGRLGPARVALDPGSAVGDVRISEGGLQVGSCCRRCCIGEHGQCCRWCMGASCCGAPAACHCRQPLDCKLLPGRLLDGSLTARPAAAGEPAGLQQLPGHRLLLHRCARPSARCLVPHPGCIEQPPPAPLPALPTPLPAPPRRPLAVRGGAADGRAAAAGLVHGGHALRPGGRRGRLGRQLRRRRQRARPGCWLGGAVLGAALLAACCSGLLLGLLLGLLKPELRLRPRPGALTQRVKKWHGEASPYGQPWAAGDVIGCCIDLESQEAGGAALPGLDTACLAAGPLAGWGWEWRRLRHCCLLVLTMLPTPREPSGPLTAACLPSQVSFWRNGRALGVAFRGIRGLAEGAAYFPAASLSSGERCCLNFGSRWAGAGSAALAALTAAVGACRRWTAAS